MIELLPHNIPTYKSLVEEIEKCTKIALIQATGTGKSYIVAKYIEEYCKKVLILVPTNSIGNQWEELVPNATIRTYQSLANMDYEEYDLIVADEMHHLGSEVWGKNFMDLFMSKPNLKIIGLTATEIRYLDNSRDMAEELFGGNAVRGVDLAEAINQGILPTFKYVSAYYGTEEDYNEYREKCGRIADKEQSEELSRRLELCIQNQISIKEAMHENLNMKDHKIIVFLNGICEIEQAVEMFRDIFPNCECNYVSSKESSKANDEAITKYQTSDAHISILFAIDMLNEGVHIDGTDCVVMFRNTISPQIYFQQLGRALSAKANYEPVAFDFACNSSSIVSVVKNKESENPMKILNKRIKDKKRKVIIKTYLKELEEVLQDIHDRIRNTLTDYEKEYISNHTEMTYTAVADILNRPLTTIHAYCNRVGIKLASKSHRFTNEEDEYLVKNAKGKRLCELQNEMGRDATAIKNRCALLGIEYKKTCAKEEQLAFIKNNQHKTAKEIADILGIDVNKVYAYARKIGVKLKKVPPQNEWSEKDDEYLRKYAPTKSKPEIGKHLNRTESAIRYRMKKLGIKGRKHDRRNQTITTTMP